MSHRGRRALCLLCACALLTGCAARETGTAPRVTLGPVVSRENAPENDERREYEQTALLYLPSLDASQLLAVPCTVSLTPFRHSAMTLCEALLSHPGTDSASSLGGGVELALSDTEAVEVSGRVATVSLGASALRLTYEQLFTVGQALADTLGQDGDVQFVNLLISGRQPGLNVASTLPAGCYQPNTREDLGTLWARASAPLTQNRRSFAAALYFPAPSGKGILCEARTLSFASQEVPGMAMALLDALSAGAETLPASPRCPDLRSLLSSPPAVDESGGSRRLSLRFSEQLNGALIDAGITRSVMMASLVYTMTTFLPGLSGVEVYIGQERIDTLTPSGVYSGAGEVIAFQDGLMRRKDFSSFLLAECALYFADAQGKLIRVFRPVPFYLSSSARALVEQLMLGPQPFDSRTGLSPVLPEELRPADLLGTALEDHTAVLNFSARLSVLAENMDGDEEKRMIYALVNTLCELPGVKKASFFVQGRQPDTLAGAVYLPGDFLPNEDLIGN